MGNSIESCEHYKQMANNFTFQGVCDGISLNQTVMCHCGTENQPKYVCLYCGYSVCKKDHIQKHFDKEESHLIYYDIDSQKILCYHCKKYLQNEYCRELSATMKSRCDDWIDNMLVKRMRFIDRSLTYELLVRNLKCKEYKNVIVLTGAGISESAGIPDFRSPGSSNIYEQILEKYELEKPEYLFELSYFIKKPEAFYELSKRFDLDKYEPTPTHYFIKLLQDKGLMKMNITQNIDNLEEKAGISTKKVFQLFGNTKGASCAQCKKKMDQNTLKDKIMLGEIYRCTSCNGPVKPNVVFFGEGLPNEFNDKIAIVEKCDLMIVIGTNLQIQPFDKIYRCPQKKVLHRLLISKQFADETVSNNHQLHLQGNCDDIIIKLVKDLEWEQDFKKILPKDYNIQF